MKTWLIIFLSIAAAIMLYLLLKEPKQTDSHKDDYGRVVAKNKVFKAKEPALIRKIDSLEQSGKRKDSANAALRAELSVTRKALDKYTTTATRLAIEVKQLSKADTTPLGRKCDSLAEVATNFQFLYEQYKAYSDSITLNLDSSKADYAEALTQQKKLYDELKQKYDALFAAYTTLFSDYSKSLKTIKRERLKTKIAVLLGLVGGAAAVLK
jgi:chromosome segregation ATPase